MLRTFLLCPVLITRFSNSNHFASSLSPPHFKGLPGTGTLPFLKTGELSLNGLVAWAVCLLVDLCSICLQSELGLFVDSLLAFLLKCIPCRTAKCCMLGWVAFIYFAHYQYTQALTLCLPHACLPSQHLLHPRGQISFILRVCLSQPISLRCSFLGCI